MSQAWVAQVVRKRPRTFGEHLLWVVAVTTVSSPIMQKYFGAAPIDHVAGATLSTFVAVGHYFWIRRLPRFRPGDIGILISLNAYGSLAHQTETTAILESLSERLRTVAESVAIPGPGRIRVRSLPSHVRLRSKEDADRLLPRCRAAYAIWATPTAGLAAGERAVDLNEVNFYVRHVEIEGPRYKAFVAELEQVHQPTRGYRVRNAHEIEDTRVVGNNLYLVARYQLGIASAANGWRDQAIELLSGVADGDARFQRTAKSELANLLISYWADGRWPTPATPKPMLDQALSDAQAGVRYDARHPAGHALLACCLFLVGRRFDANTQNDLQKPFDENVWRMNRAAFALERNDFDDALRHYERAYRRGFGTTDDTRRALAESSLQWLYDAEEVYGTRFAFGVAYVNDRLKDRQMALLQYEAVLPLVPPGRARSFVENRIQDLREAAA